MTEITMIAHMFTAVVIILTTVLVLMFRAVFSPPSSDRSQDGSEHGGSPVPNTSSSEIESSSPGCWKYDVFLSFRGEDVRKNFVDHLYNALVERTILTYKDDETLPRGDTIGPALLKAIQESRIALIVFSKNYADSSWCLDELAYIMKCKEERGKIVIPIFYDVVPSDVRKQKGEFGKAFSKQKSANNEKVESWKKALVDASEIAGWETNLVANGHEAKCIKQIVGSVFDKLQSLNSAVDDDDELVGMVTRLQDLKSQLEIGSGGVLMVGIWGVGGGGKTTLATSLYMEISANFSSCCFVENVREESKQQHGLKKLQEKILSAVFNDEIKLETVVIGKQKIKQLLCSRKVLVVLDDVDDLEQLEALAGRHNWFGYGSRIIITTRDEHVLTTHGVDKVCPVSLLSHEEAIRLFRTHAYHEDNPVEDYDELSLRVIEYVNGLPLALKIIGSFLKDKDKNGWLDTLDKLKETPNLKVTEQLKISYDGLDPDLKELFLDIACFFRGTWEEKAMKILDACGFHPRIGVTVLKQKSLITISKYGEFDMHDLVQEMGHHIVRGKHPDNPETHSTVWRKEDIKDLCTWNATTENHMIEAIQYECETRKDIEDMCAGNTTMENHMIARNTSLISIFQKNHMGKVMTLVSNLKKLRFVRVLCRHEYHEDFYACCRDEGAAFLSNDLKYINLDGYPASVFPESFQPRKLVVLKLCYTLQEELWKGKKYMPCLKELRLNYMTTLVRTPDISGLSCLQNLIIKNCQSLEEIHQSLGNHTSLVNLRIQSCNMLASFPTIIRMEKLKMFKISRCGALLEFPNIEANMDSLENLELMDLEIEVLPSSVGRYCTNLISLTLDNCSKLKTIEGNFHALKRLKKFELYVEKFPKDLFDVKCCLEELRFRVSRFSGKLNIFPPSPPHLPHLLRKLNLSWCKLKDGEIPREIGGLSSLIELHLDYNHFSRVDINLSQLTQLKLLSLSYCKMLVELPELPLNLAILRAKNCNSLKAIREDIYSNCKWLCSFSVRSIWGEYSGNIFGGKRLLESMLQGNVVENHQCMSLILRGVEVLKKFEPGWLRGRRYSLQLPENWFNEYTGFLFCSVFEKGVPNTIQITLEDESVDDEQVFFEEDESVDDEHVFFEEDESVDDEQVFSEEDESVDDEHVFSELYKKVRNTNIQTWVVYVSFGSLKSTAWWDQTSTALDFSISQPDVSRFGGRLVSKKNQMKETTTKNSSSEFDISGFGARLVSKKNQMKETTTKNSSSEFAYDDGDYKCRFRISHDSKSKLKCLFQSFDD